MRATVLRGVVLAWLVVICAAGWAQSNVALKLGENYREIAPQPVADPSRIEVIDFFFYACPFCNRLHPLLERWRAELPKDVVFRRIPVIRHDHWAPLARTYYTLEVLGQVERLHGEVYKGYHVEELSMSRPEVMADWAQRHGIERQRWLDAYHSEEVTRRVEHARRLTREYDVQETPTIVVAGRYSTSSGMTADVKLVPPVAELLVRMVRAKR